MNKRTLYAFLISFLLLITAIFINRRSFDNMKEYISSATHSREMITSLERLLNYFKSLQMFKPIYTVEEEEAYYRLYLEEAKNVFFEVMRLKNLTVGDSFRDKRIDTISMLINEQYSVLLNNSIADLIATNQAWRLTKLHEAHKRINQCIAHERNVLITLDAEAKASTETTNLLTTLFAVIASVIIALTFIFNVILARKGKWLEGFLESILDTSQNGIISYKAIRKQGKIVDFKIEFANAAIEKHLNIKPQALIGKKLSETQPYVLIFLSVSCKS